MQTTFFCSLALAALLAGARAQQPTAAPKTTAAEQAFRDAWWAESGQGDLAGALAKYLAAATADGPLAVHANALLHAGAVQQRLGKTESAIATFRQLLEEHPGEADLVEQARVHLRELTAVDLTTGYDEWYERRLFSEEVQIAILDRIQALAKALAEAQSGDAEKRAEQDQRKQALRSEILGYGKGAVRALRKACESGHEQLAEAAVEMLFDLQQVPPLAALRRLQGWTYDASRWRLLVERPSSEPRSLPAAATPHERLVVAALGGAESLVGALLHETFAEDENPVAPIAEALILQGPECRQRICAAMSERQVPLVTRQALQGAVAQMESVPPFTASEWLEMGADPLVFDLRRRAIDMAAQRIGAADAGLLDMLLERVVSAPATLRANFFEQLANGLRRNGSPLLVPWTVSRLHTLMCLANSGADSEIHVVLNVLRGDDELRTMLAEALLAQPLATHQAWHPAPTPEWGLHGLLRLEGVEEPQAELLATRWHTSLAAVLAAAWPKWSDAERGAAIGIVGEATAECGDTKALREFTAGVRRDADASLHAPLDALLAQLKR